VSSVPWEDEGSIGWRHAHCLVREVQRVGGYVQERAATSQRFGQWVFAPTVKTFEISLPKGLDDEALVTIWSPPWYKLTRIWNNPNRLSHREVNWELKPV